MENVFPDIKEDLKGTVLVIKVKGKLDTTLTPLLEKKICDCINKGHLNILLDLSEISYINSPGLRMLLSIKKQMKTQSGKFVICGLKTEVHEVMKICGFDHVIEIFPNEEDGLKHF